MAASIIGGALIAALILIALANIYGPEAHNLVFGGPPEHEERPSPEDRAAAVSDCLRNREWRQRQFVREHGEIDIPTEAIWTYVPDQEASYELWKRQQSSVGYERLRAVRIDSQRLERAISESGNVFGAEVFPELRYLFTVDRTSQASIGADSLVSASGTLAGSAGATGRWSFTVNRTSGEVLGSIDASDSWIRLLVGIENSSLTVFAEIDQCRRFQVMLDKDL